MLFRKILVAFDGSHQSRLALRKSIELTQHRPAAEIDVLYVSNVPKVWYPELPAASMYELESRTAQTLLAEAETALKGADRRWRTLIAEGRPAKTIVEHAVEGGYDLIIMGSRGRSGLTELFLGSVSHNVVQHSPVPVLIMKSGPADRNAPQHQEVREVAGE